MARPWLPLAAVVALLSLPSCDDSTTTAQYLRCFPELTALSPDTAAIGEEVLLTGHHFLAYRSGTFDAAGDLAVTFGSQRAEITAVSAPREDEEGACDACATCVEAQDEGCYACDVHCSLCFVDVAVLVPDGDGSAPVSLTNGMGQSGALTFTWLAEPTATPSAAPRR